MPKGTCSITGCVEPTVGQKLCRRHYDWFRSTGSTDPPPRIKRGGAYGKKICRTEGCDARARRRGYCLDHLATATEFRCSSCQVWKSVDEFTPDHVRCRACVRILNKIRYNNDPSAWKRNSDTVHWLNIKAQFGLTKDDYERMLVEQGGGCAICHARPKKRRLHIDHDHVTGKVRGLLCFRCNTGLGHFQDDPTLLLAAAAYVA